MAMEVTIKTERLMLDDLMDLESAGTSPKATFKWLVKHCGLTPEQAKAIPWEDLPAINEQIMAQVKKRQQLPKATNDS